MDGYTAETLAADLAGAKVDPNEAQKALAYLRKNRDEKQFFAYLRAIVQDGRAVIRSGRTLDYYRNLLTACERHLRGMPADEMAQTLGWAIRLLRYYKAVPDAARKEHSQLPVDPKQQIITDFIQRVNSMVPKDVPGALPNLANQIEQLSVSDNLKRQAARAVVEKADLHINRKKLQGKRWFQKLREFLDTEPPV